MHNHEMTREEIRKCMLKFGRCYTNPPTTYRKGKHGPSNKPSGASVNDQKINY